MALNEINLEDILQNEPKGQNVDSTLQKLPTLARWYIDTREWNTKGLDLPLLETLRPHEQEAVKRFYHTADKQMSLASHLLKYLYIHHVYGIPWKSIVLGRTDPPQRRPCFNSTTLTKVEFNVSHQASLTILAGTVEPDDRQLSKLAAANISALRPQVGIDITCVNERKPITTYTALIEHVEIFSEVFSTRELDTMKKPQLVLAQAQQLGYAQNFSIQRQDDVVRFGLRLFYSYWALKEAYVKMTGEALLALWLRELEFTNVIPPDPIDPLPTSKPYTTSDRKIPQSPKNWGLPYTGVVISKSGEVLDDVRIELVAFESDYIVATAGSGCTVGVVPHVAQAGEPSRLGDDIYVRLPGGGLDCYRIPLSAKRLIGDMDPWNLPGALNDPWLPMQEVDIDLDVRACAEGHCSHPTEGANILSCVEERR
ncbi:4'-phosphopantetheinyl transferase A [Penicillium cinerascens]|uniref:holo-[acyl-carrier-protein] synthase n=1 Tax=Penicillium cinerascens TaxID=70096 RepID=A0A9W9NGW3_9EURO|nr:4'-phosphopantetheinyl transferase A [Penicillium cinerascens]KAJ5218469.1 4'-phosphopantetheinyl transferase A [Penicillium cinerascens]